MKILFAVSECVPFVKSGGLADVAEALPKELSVLGADIRVILPKYGAIAQEYEASMRKIAEFNVKVGWRNQYCGIEELKYEGMTYYFVDNEYYFKQNRLYGYFDDGERFAFFNRAVLETFPHICFYPHVIHCHDWHTGMIPFLLKAEYQSKKNYEFIQTVFTIHNLQFQGIMSKETLGDLFGLNDRYLHHEQLEFFGEINLMKGALVAADKITTVSPTYKEEIQTEYYGERLHGLLQKRTADLVGILNGINTKLYNPKIDHAIFQQYGVGEFDKKRENKLKLQERFGLPQNRETPLIALISRLTAQKGIELVQCVFHEMLAEDVQFVILGTGDAVFEQFFRKMEAAYPRKFKAFIGFDEDLAHQIYAGADLFLMPSKFEPCGLGQMIAMRYGAVPIVRETGGLNDTVKAFNEQTGDGNGFSFRNFNAHEMLFTIEQALSFYREEECFQAIVKNAMTMDFSWANSALQYYSLYSRLISRSEQYVFE